MIYISIALVILFIWVSWVSVSYFRLRSKYLTLTQGVHRKSLETVLSNLVSGLQESKKDIANIIARCDKIEKEERYHIQKIGLLRFNPFKDTGGDQSFIIALVDAFDTGIIITALYSRTGTRWYTKRVIRGKGHELELSEEEKKAVQMAEGIKAQ